MSEQLGFSQKSILLVDDDKGARESIRMLLAVDGHAVTEAENGAEALERFRPGRFDLVITDYLMPNMLGDELARTIRTLVPEQPIVMVSGYFEDLCSRAVSADALLAKPFGMAELRMVIAKPMARLSDQRVGGTEQRIDFQSVETVTLKDRAAATTRVLRQILDDGEKFLKPHR